MSLKGLVWLLTSNDVMDLKGTNFNKFMEDFKRMV